MNEPPLIGRQRTLLRDLARVATEKERLEPAIAKSYLTESERAQQEFDEGNEALRKRAARAKETLDEELRIAREAIEGCFAAEQQAAQKEHTRNRRELTQRLEVDREAAQTAFEEARWTTEAALEGAVNDAKTQLREDNARLAAQADELSTLREQARSLLEERKLPLGKIEQAADDAVKAAPRPARKLEESMQDVENHITAIEHLIIPGFLKGKRLLGLTLLLWLALTVPVGFLLTSQLEVEAGLPHLLGLGAAGAAVAAVLAGVVARAVFRSMAQKQVAKVYLPLWGALADAEAAREQLAKRYQADHDQAVADARDRHDRKMARSEAKHQQKLSELANLQVAGFVPLDERFKALCTAGERRRNADLQAAEQRHSQGHAQTTQRCSSGLEKLQAKHRARTDEINSRYQQEWQLLMGKWQRLVTTALETASEVIDESDDLFPGWDDPFWNNWLPPASLPPAAIRFGSYQVKTESVVEAEPWAQPRPKPAPVELTLPALYAFPEPASILYHTQDEGRDRAVDSLRAVMFRLLTALQPGRVRFTIIDPVGLGQNFAAFMNLADHDEALVGSRIWTEAAHIEQRLADLTAHMENVIQKYLRNRYPTISDYNIQAGEVAEPFRVLVVANFPANFTTEAVRRLVSIAQSGPRCGVSTLISYDTKQALPKEFDLADLERCGINLVWKDGRFNWRDEDFGRYPLALDQLPSDEFCNRILHRVGDAARNAQRVEVPFEFIAPQPEQWWKGNASKGISVPLGRSGATKRQLLELGRGTSQHALVAGKTGSGKSTLLHALITNLALMYSPDEVELYLVDFKKGVEFKTYAAHELPHARVIAIESEREFGLSVLQRLDAELKARGESFRAVGAQDLNGFRQGAPGARSPRILLIVDEFQEFFVEDDKIGQAAAQLLDRLVRQGRAFGMHVLLGSQTLGGAYSLARSTIDQMAVRIALQCSEADAHLILSDDNSAARLLSRPGEAIYNDANGLVEGNDPFQVVWLSEEQREGYLAHTHELARRFPPAQRPSTVIFEGNASADVSKNHLLNRLLQSPPSGDEEAATRVEEAWLGEAMAIDELTAATFRRQNGSNLLIIGQQPEAALGMLTTGVISLAAHTPPRANGESAMPRFYFIDGHQADAPRTGVLARLPEVVPEPVRVSGWRDLPAVMTELSAELERRQSAPNADAPAIYLILYGLQRLRDLRRSEDDFGFSSKSDDQPASPDKQMATLLREGSVLGIHTLIWCDTLNNLQRALDRQALRELSMRVVFQMSVADSSNLIDNPMASKLGMHRALFANEEDGRLDKFRPYEVPSEEWLSWVREQLRQRGAVVAAPSGSA